MKFIGNKLNFIVPITLALALTQGFTSILKTDTQKVSYSLGASTGNYIGNQIYSQIKLGTKIDVDLVVKGFSDALKQKLELSEKDIISNLNNRAKILNEIKKKKFKKVQNDNLKKEKNFFEKNSKKNGVKITKSGLQYKVIRTSKGKKAKPESIVIIKYKAFLIDGYVFDDTYARKAPAHLSMVNIVDGLKEGLMLMSEGSKYKLYIPSKLAYGSIQMRDIPPNSTLIFEVELVKVLKPGAMKQKSKFEMSGHGSTTKEAKKVSK